MGGLETRLPTATWSPVVRTNLGSADLSAARVLLAVVCLRVNRRRGQAVADIGSNAVKAIKKGQSKWGHHRRRSGPHPDADSFIRHKELLALVQGVQFGADSQLSHGDAPPPIDQNQ